MLVMNRTRHTTKTLMNLQRRTAANVKLYDL